MAVLRIAAFDESGKLLGHRVLPIDGLRPGYRHICLRNELNQPQNLATLFVHLSVRDYVSDALAGDLDSSTVYYNYNCNFHY